MDSIETPPEGFSLDDLFEVGTWRVRSRKAKRRRPRPERPAFLTLSRRKRRDLTVALAARIQSDPNGRGVFTSHDILPGSREWLDPDGTSGVQWADAYFLSRQPRRFGRFYNATVQTTAMKVAEYLEHLVQEAIEAQVEAAAPGTRTRSRVYSREIAGGGREMRFGAPPALECLGGLSVAGAQAAWLRARWDALETLATPALISEVRTDTSYAYGIGLHLTVPETRLTVERIVAAIERFWNQGEPEQASAPVAYDQVQSVVEQLLRVHLHHWDIQQAHCTGEEPPEWPEELVEIASFQSNAVRMPR